MKITKEHHVVFKIICASFIVAVFIFFQQSFLGNNASAVFLNKAEAATCGVTYYGPTTFPAGCYECNNGWTGCLSESTYGGASGINCTLTSSCSSPAPSNYSCTAVSGTFTYPYDYPAYTIPGGTYDIIYAGGSLATSFNSPGFSEDPGVLAPGYYWGSRREGGCGWSLTIVNSAPSPPSLSWYGTPNGTVLSRGEDYNLDLRADKAINAISLTSNIWGDGTDHSGAIEPGSSLVGDFNCADGGCMGNVQWSNPGRQWGSGFAGLSSGLYSRNIYMRSTDNVWSGAFYNTFTIAPPPSYTHYSVGQWSSCTGYNMTTGDGGAQTRTVTSYTDSNPPSDSASADSQSCSVSIYTHYNVGSYGGCTGYDSLTGQGGTQTRSVSSYTNTTSPNDSAPSSSQSCNMPADFDLLLAPVGGDGGGNGGGEGGGVLGNTYSTFVTFIGNQQKKLSAPVTIAINSIFPNHPSLPNLTFSIVNVLPSLPPGVEYFFNPNPLTPTTYANGTKFTIDVPRTEPGLYIITLEISGGGLVKQATVNLNVNIINPTFQEI